jgi:hypothetical protein
MWGVHNTRLFPWNKTLKFPISGQFISNGHMAGNCPSMSGLRQECHNNALQLLLTLLEHSKGGRWKTITADFGSKPSKSFTSHTFSVPLPHIDTPSFHRNQMSTRRVDAEEGLDHSSITRCPAALRENILPIKLGSPAHKPDFIRLLEPRLVGHTLSRRRYSTTRKIQTRELKYCTHNNPKTPNISS